jgi:uncharacterized phage protein (TIGR01671 family)
MIPKYRFWCVAGMFNVVSIDFEKQEVSLDDGDIRKIEDGTLMQFAGLKDRNGIEIFEGDIVRVNNENFEVVFDIFHEPKKLCFLRIKGFHLRETPANGGLLLGILEMCEVIGNIYDNPELLESEASCSE